MRTSSRQWILASSIALASIAGVAQAQVIAPVAPNTAPTVNAAPNTAPTVAPNVAPTTTVSPTVSTPATGTATTTAKIAPKPVPKNKHLALAAGCSGASQDVSLMDNRLAH